MEYSYEIEEEVLFLFFYINAHNLVLHVIKVDLKQAYI